MLRVVREWIWNYDFSTEVVSVCTKSVRVQAELAVFGGKNVNYKNSKENLECVVANRRKAWTSHEETQVF